jgi:hypothetical protein
MRGIPRTKKKKRRPQIPGIEGIKGFRRRQENSRAEAPNGKPMPRRELFSAVPRFQSVHLLLSSSFFICVIS